MVSINVLTAVKIVTKKFLIFVTIVVTVAEIAVQMLTKKVSILFQMFTKKFLISVQTSLQDVPNQPKNTSAMPFSVLRILEKQFLIKSHIPTKCP